MKRFQFVSPHDIPLSPREVEVVRGLAQGEQVQAVAKRLNISTNTASAHLYKAVRKLGVSGRAELTIAAIRIGIVPCPCPKHIKSAGVAA